MVPAGGNKSSWTFPESAEVLETSIDQVMATKVKVQYLGTVRIRVTLPNDVVKSMDDFVIAIDH